MSRKSNSARVGIPNGSTKRTTAAGHLKAGKGERVRREVLSGELGGTQRLIAAAFKVWCIRRGFGSDGSAYPRRGPGRPRKPSK